MRTTRSRARYGAIAAVAALSLGAAACGDDSDDTADAPMDSTMDETMDSTMDETMDSTIDSTMGSGMDGEMMEPSGPGCAAVPAEGDGSFEGMADDPAATAASANPELSTLVAAVDAAGLVDTLNGDGPFTIFAPANSAFEKIPAEDLDALLADPTGALTDILTLHVVQGEQMSSADLAEAGTVTAIAGELTLAAEGDSITVDAGGGPATVVCADVQTANATVHIIDTVLTPAG
ncbi:MAG: fasciclin domain-containing protein [Actinomycetota bacterium]|nr:fasciclin domain-containing protein [Actinomycetota bacterium]